jgi:chemotaxis protein methyltransferase CheR
MFHKFVDPFGLIDSEELRVVEANEAACRLFGYRRDELLGRLVYEMHPPSSVQEYIEAIEGVVRSGGGGIKESRLLARDGNVIEALVVMVPLDLEGQPYVAVAVRDDTEKRRAERALFESERKYSSMMDAMEDAVYICSPDLRVSYMNPAMVRRVGESAIDEPCYRVIHRLNEQCPWCVHDQVQRGEHVQTEITSPLDGLYYHVSHSPILHADGSISKVTIYRDITREKHSQQVLQRAYSEIKQLKEQIEADYTYLREEIKLEHDYGNIVGKSRAIKGTLLKVEQVAGTDTTVLIMGETGTGKELIARAIHGLSPRKNRPLVKVNCAALPSNLIESELFGHERGAFTGALSMHKGRFEVADGGTLFLDEIGEVPLELQMKLLRVIEHGEFERLGSSRTIKVDVRVVAATNRDLLKESREGRFRQDLYYRLNVFPVLVPPLRERKEDIPLLLSFLVGKLNKKIGRQIERIPNEVVETFRSYSWPGNVREFENIVERAVINSRGNTPCLADGLEASESACLPSSPRKLVDVERGHIIKTLEQTKWKIAGPKGAASALGMPVSTLRSRMQKLGIRTRYREP